MCHVSHRSRLDVTIGSAEVPATTCDPAKNGSTADGGGGDGAARARELATWLLPSYWALLSTGFDDAALCGTIALRLLLLLQQVIRRMKCRMNRRMSRSRRQHNNTVDEDHLPHTARSRMHRRDLVYSAIHSAIYHPQAGMLKESVAVGRKALFEVQKSRGAEIVALAARGVQAMHT